MGVQPPYIYEAIKSEGPKSPYKPFDPKAVSRASLQPKPQRMKQEGPLLSFNQHPDSYLILPYGKNSAVPLSPSVKAWVKWMRIIQLVFRCLELLCAGGLLAVLIILRGMDYASGLMIRIAPGVAILHTLYGIYHLARRSSGRTPASSASYMMFASFFDVSIVPFYAFAALLAYNHHTDIGSWTIILNSQAEALTFVKIVFLLAVVGGGLHLFSLVIGIYLAVTFRKIDNMPPDMNPLEDNLTSRHKRNKSSISVTTTLTQSEKRLSAPLESKRSSGATYEDLSRPPTIPFFHTRTQSTDSLSTYRTTPPGSRDSRIDLPSRQYQAVSNSARSSVIDLKRASYGPPTPPKRSSYVEPTSPKRASYTGGSASSSQQSSRPGKASEKWFTSDSLSKSRSRSGSPKKGYQPVHQRQGSSDDLGLPNPLESNPPTPSHKYKHGAKRDSASLKISQNRLSGDIADMSSEREVYMEPAGDNFKAKRYGELKPGTPPLIIGSINRQVSSGTDFIAPTKGYLRGVSGKMAEEGRGGSSNGWGARFRKVSGLD